MTGNYFTTVVQVFPYFLVCEFYEYARVAMSRTRIPHLHIF